MRSLSPRATAAIESALDDVEAAVHEMSLDNRFRTDHMDWMFDLPRWWSLIVTVQWWPFATDRLTLLGVAHRRGRTVRMSRLVHLSPP